jgi:hypothetical protein
MCDCRLCRSADKLFKAMVKNYDEPGDALHVLTICTFKCLQATDSDPTLQMDMIHSIHEMLMKSVKHSTMH